MFSEVEESKIVVNARMVCVSKEVQLFFQGVLDLLEKLSIVSMSITIESGALRLVDIRNFSTLAHSVYDSFLDYCAFNGLDIKNVAEEVLQSFLWVRS